MPLDYTHLQRKGFVVNRVSPQLPPAPPPTATSWPGRRDEVLLRQNPIGQNYMTHPDSDLLPGVEECQKQLKILRSREHGTRDANKEHELDTSPKRRKAIEDEIERMGANLHFETFKHFKKLPSELRLPIWELACSDPCVVEVHPVQLSIDYSISGANGQEQRYHGSVTHLRSKTPPCPLLSVCSESRAVAMDRYGPSGMALANPFVPDLAYFNNKLDTLYLSQAALDCFADSRGRTFQFFLPFRKANEEASPAVTKEYGRCSTTGIAFPPRTPAGQAVIRVRSLGIEFSWFFDLEQQTSALVLNMDGSRRKHSSLLSFLFYFSDLEEIVVVFDKTRNETIKEQRSVSESDADGLGPLMLRCMEREWPRIEKSLTGAYVERYSRIGKPLPTIRTLVINNSIP